MAMVKDPRWVDREMEDLGHNTIEFATRDEARAYLKKHKLVNWYPYGLARNGGLANGGIEVYMLAPERFEQRSDKGSVKDQLLALYEECGTDRNIFVSAAEILGIKPSTATTYWYDIKRGTVA